LPINYAYHGRVTAGIINRYQITADSARGVVRYIGSIGETRGRVAGKVITGAVINRFWLTSGTITLPCEAVIVVDPSR